VLAFPGTSWEERDGSLKISTGSGACKFSHSFCITRNLETTLPFGETFSKGILGDSSLFM
jgi:hypothetical protein